MILQRFYDEKLAQASYLIGCAVTREALIVDANRDVDQYIRAATAEGVRITHVTETHIHADFVSGSRELASRTGAALFLSAEGGDDWQYGFAESARATLLRHGVGFRVGNIRIDVVHTPGHTPEHVSFLVTDGAASDRPIGILTGDFVFVGDVGRPDLLEKAAGIGGTMEAGARQLFHSLQAFRTLPDYLQVWPGHGAGSACGKSLSGVPTSTVGYERLANWALRIDSEEEFVREVLTGQPEPPRYFAEMKKINRDGPRILGGFRRPERLPADRLREILSGGALVVDTRSGSEFAGGHVPGTVSIPLERSFTTWAGWLIPYDRDFYLLIDDRCNHCVDEAFRDLAMIGLDRTAGYFGADAVDASRNGGLDREELQHVEPAELDRMRRNGEAAIIDVRSAEEWEAGHIPGVRHLPLGQLTANAKGLSRKAPVVVYCQTGRRSAIGASLLRVEGFEQVLNLRGGFEAWRSAGHPVEN